MVRSQSFKKLLEIKRKKFFEAVYRICKKRDLQMPSINFKGCDKEHGDQLAHYDPETNTICVSERQLNMLDFEDIEEVAAHEVSHILVQDHGSAFRTEEEVSSIAGFKPPSSTVTVQEGKKHKASKKRKKSRADKTRCNYHLCRKRKKLTQCEYCKSYYCEKHLQPKPPGLPRFKSTKPEDKLFMKEWRKKRGHPCAPYREYWVATQERKKKEYREALDKLIRSKPLKERYEYELPKREKWVFDKELIKFVAIGILLIVVLILFIILKKNIG